MAAVLDLPSGGAAGLGKRVPLAPREGAPFESCAAETAKSEQQAEKWRNNFDGASINECKLIWRKNRSQKLAAGSNTRVCMHPAVASDATGEDSSGCCQA
jgi:hypothetical protein